MTDPSANESKWSHSTEEPSTKDLSDRIYYGGQVMRGGGEFVAKNIFVSAMAQPAQLLDNVFGPLRHVAKSSPVVSVNVELLYRTLSQVDSNTDDLCVSYVKMIVAEMPEAATELKALIESPPIQQLELPRTREYLRTLP